MSYSEKQMAELSKKISTFNKNVKTLMDLVKVLT